MRPAVSRLWVCIITCLKVWTSSQKPHITCDLSVFVATESSGSSSHCLSGSGSSGSDSGCVSSHLPEALSEEPSSPCDSSCYSSITSPTQEKTCFNSQYISAVSITCVHFRWPIFWSHIFRSTSNVTDAETCRNTHAYASTNAHAPEDTDHLMIKWDPPL